ncbi:hypothetical protein SAMN04487769_1383 [Burkholderia sp. b14]|nr:hypothetical protein SAMN04487769_1383 [Burkholderia sp. b14]
MGLAFLCQLCIERFDFFRCDFAVLQCFAFSSQSGIGNGFQVEGVPLANSCGSGMRLRKLDAEVKIDRCAAEHCSDGKECPE